MSLENKKSYFVEILKEVTILSQFVDQELEQLVDFGEERVVESFNNIIVEGESSWGIYLILEGVVGISKSDRMTGGHFDLAELKKGNFFGEMSLVDENPRSATVRALTFCELFFISKQQFEKFLLIHSSYSTRFYKSCVDQLVNRLRSLSDSYIVSQYQLWKNALQKKDHLNFSAEGQSR